MKKNIESVIHSLIYIRLAQVQSIYDKCIVIHVDTPNKQITITILLMHKFFNV